MLRRGGTRGSASARHQRASTISRSSARISPPAQCARGEAHHQRVRERPRRIAIAHVRLMPARGPRATVRLAQRLADLHEARQRRVKRQRRARDPREERLVAAADQDDDRGRDARHAVRSQSGQHAALSSTCTQSRVAQRPGSKRVRRGPVEHLRRGARGHERRVAEQPVDLAQRRAGIFRRRPWGSRRAAKCSASARPPSAPTTSAFVASRPIDAMSASAGKVAPSPVRRTRSPSGWIANQRTGAA